MALERLTVEDLRCLREVRIEPTEGINLVIGANASGKTSLLEAIFFLGRGRTFRGARREAAIREGAECLRVVGRVGGGPTVGIQVARNEWTARAGGEPVASLAELATVQPVQLMDPDIHRLVEEGPGERRRYLDWATFHVKPAFLGAWRSYQRALRQRNAALRAGARSRGLEVWNEQMVQAGTVIDALRREVTEDLGPPVADAACRLLGSEVRIRYRPGQPAGESLAEALLASEERDRRTGITQVGPHRADLAVEFEAHRARGWVSRGQQKLVAAALVLGQAAVLAPLWEGRGILLVDDPAAELDAVRLAALVEYIRCLPFQVFVTGVDRGALPGLQGARVFHVEQGEVRPVV
jgi:DNA replication and repair protein RecF